MKTQEKRYTVKKDGRYWTRVGETAGFIAKGIGGCYSYPLEKAKELARQQGGQVVEVTTVPGGFRCEEGEVIDWDKDDLYAEIVKAGIPMTNHESDLYFRKTEESTAILERFPLQHGNATCFVNQADPHKGETWYDVPFAFTPFWQAKRR
jgi:hypothetical protein